MKNRRLRQQKRRKKKKKKEDGADLEIAGETLILVPVLIRAPGGHGLLERGPGHGQIQEPGGGEVRPAGVHQPKGENRPIPEKEKIPDPDPKIEVGENPKKEIFLRTIWKNRDTSKLLSRYIFGRKW